MKVSVIIPVYQVEAYVEECLRSVMRQTLPDLEIICIEDAGTDGSAEIVRRIGREDPRVSLWVNEKNRGLAAVRNEGLERARGKYVYFLDSDDMIKPDALLSLYRRAEEESLDVCIFQADFIYETEELRQRFHTNPAVFKGSYPDVLDGKTLYKEWMKVWDWVPSQPRYFYRRAFLEENGLRFMEGMLHEDERFAFDVLMSARRVRVMKEAFFIRRFRASSIMSSQTTMRSVESCVEIMDHTASRDTEDEALDDAVRFYNGKLFKDAVRKYRSVLAQGLPGVPSDEYLDTPGKTELFRRIRKKSRLELFACSSYYQVLIALAKALSAGMEADLLLEEHGIGTAGELSLRLTEVFPDTVRRAAVIPTSPEVDPYEQKETAGDRALSEKLAAYMEGLLKEKDFFLQYDEVNVFWDLGYTGTYLNIKQIPYTLHEDSLDSYRKIRENRPNYAYIFDEKARKEHVGVVPFGWSPWCNRVELNDADGIQIPPDKVTVCPRGELMESLSASEKKQIMKAFLPADFSVEGGGMLLLTEPFAVTGRLPDEESQRRLYEKIIRRYGEGRAVVIKAHPRDTMDYGRYFPEAQVIEKNIPMEVLNFDAGVSFGRAVTVTSSAIEGLRNVQEKIVLGPGFLRDYLETERRK